MAKAHSQVWDEETKCKHEQQTRILKHKKDVKTWIEAEEQLCTYVEDGDLGFTNAEKQMGRYLWSSEFEKRLGKIVPESVFFIDNSWKPGFRAVMQRRPDGTIITLSPYEKGVMPERSVIKVKEEIRRDPNVWHIDRKDMPKAEWVDGEFKWDKNVLRPGYRRRMMPWGELKRGWRTVLLQLVKQKVLSPAIVELNFGSDNTLGWAAHMGKQDVKAPW